MKTNSKEIIFEFDLPDYKKEEVQVKLYKNSLIIRAEKKQKNRMQKEDFFHVEKTHKKFKYATTLPRINPDKARIEFRKGKLRIIAPKEKNDSEGIKKFLKFSRNSNSEED